MVVECRFVGFGIGRFGTGLHQFGQIRALKARIARPADPEKIMVLIHVHPLTRAVRNEQIARRAANAQRGTRYGFVVLARVQMQPRFEGVGSRFPFRYVAPVHEILRGKGQPRRGRQVHDGVVERGLQGRVHIRLLIKRRRGKRRFVECLTVGNIAVEGRGFGDDQSFQHLPHTLRPFVAHGIGFDLHQPGLTCHRIQRTPTETLGRDDVLTKALMSAGQPGQLARPHRRDADVGIFVEHAHAQQCTGQQRRHVHVGHRVGVTLNVRFVKQTLATAQKRDSQ